MITLKKTRVRNMVWGVMLTMSLVAQAQVSYFVDPVAGDDANPAGKPWKTFGRLNGVTLAPGDTVTIAPGVQEESFMPMGEGTAEKPVVIKFLPGIHTLNIRKVTRKKLFISNSIDSEDPIPVGIILSQVKHFRVQGGGVEGANKTTLLYGGRMMRSIVMEPICVPSAKRASGNLWFGMSIARRMVLRPTQQGMRLPS